MNKRKADDELGFVPIDSDLYTLSNLVPLPSSDDDGVYEASKAAPSPPFMYPASQLLL